MAAVRAGDLAQEVRPWDRGDHGAVAHDCRAASHSTGLCELSIDLKSPTGPRCVSLSGLTIELMLVIWPLAFGKVREDF
jgi:hypothetical protein